MDHRIDGRVIFPATGYLCLVWRTLARALGLALEQTPVVFEDVTLHQATILPKTGESATTGRLGVAVDLALTLLLHRDHAAGGAAAGGLPHLRGV